MRKHLTSAIAIALVGLALASPALATETVTALPLADFFDVVLDESRGRLYYTAGHPHDVLVATDLDGANPTTLTGLEGASGITLSEDAASLFVALAGSNAVSRIDLATLSEAERFALPTDVCPGSVAVTAGYVAVGHSCNQYAGTGLYGGVGVLDPTTGAWNPLEAPGPFYKPYVTAAAGSNGLFVTGDLGLSPTTLYTIGIYDGIGDTISSRSNTGSNLRDLAISPDGGLVVQASGYPYQHDVFGVFALNPVLAYETTNYPNAAAWSGDGFTVATGTDSAYDDDVRIHHRDSPTPFATFELGARLAPRGLAITADGSTAFAVSETGGSFALHVLPTGPVASTLTLTTSQTAEVGTSTEFTGVLSFTDGSDSAGQTVTLTRSYADVVQALPSVTTGAGGAFSFSDVPQVATTITYTAAYAGDASHGASNISTDLQVTKRATDLTIEVATATGKKNRNKVVVSAQLGDTYTNRIVTITASDSRGTRVIASGAVDGGGILDVTYRVRRTTTFTVEFAGDAWYLPASASTTYVK